jgi:transcriptional regulator with XRE-family HTH domain
MAVSENYIGQLERGKIRWPGKTYREALRAILNVPTDFALGFVNTRRLAVKLDDVKRRKFTETTTLGAGRRRTGCCWKPIPARKWAGWRP